MGTVPPQLRFEESLWVPGHESGQEEEVAVGSCDEGRYLVVELPGWAGPCWVCAPASDRAIECVRSGRVSPWTVLHHSLTGTVEIYRTTCDGSLHVSVQLCSRLPVQQPVHAAA